MNRDTKTFLDAGRAMLADRDEDEGAIANRSQPYQAHGRVDQQANAGYSFESLGEDREAMETAAK